MQGQQRLNRISRQLSKLNHLIQFTKNESLAAFQILQNCHNSSSSSSMIEDQHNDSHAISQMFDEADSRDTIQIANNNISDQFFQNKSLQISRPSPNNKEHQENSNSQYNMYQSNLSSEGFKESTIEISQIKPVDTTIKKAKLLKTNLNKNKKNLFEKQRILSNNEKSQKIGRIKSENKLISNASNFKRGINLIKQQMSLKKQKTHKGTPQITQNISIPSKNYLSSKIQTLNSKRNFKYNSVTKNQKAQKYEKYEKVQKNSKNKFHINLEKQVTMKITDLKIKKNLCQIETSYLSASVKITKEEISRIDDSVNQYSDQTLLKYFILKSIIKFISQYNDETWTNSEDIEIDNDTVTNTLKKPEKFIKIINKLPDILRRKNIVSEFICKEFIEQKSFIEQKVNNLSAKNFQKQPLYNYLCQLHLYIEFLLNNNMIHQTKRHKIFNPTSQEFFSDRSTKEMKLTANAIKDSKFRESKKKDFSERKKNGATTLKRVNTSKALKKGTTTTKPKKII